MAKLGYTFRVAREAQGLSLGDVERGTRINRSYLIALEADAYEDLPPSFYTTNLIRQYAAFLDLPAEPLVRLYPQAGAPPPMEPSVKLTKPGSNWGVWLLVVGVVVLIVGLGAALVRASTPEAGRALAGPVVRLTITPPPAASPDTPEPGAAAATEPDPEATPESGGTPGATATPGADATPTPTPGAAATPTPTVEAPVTVAVLAVTGIGAAEAEQRLAQAGLTVSRQEAWSSSVPAGQVIEQNPAAGSQRPQGGAVIIVVNRGPQGTIVPNVVGLPEAQAIGLLRDAGLTVNPNINRQGPDQVPDRVRQSVCVGCVLSTQPAPGVAVDPGSVVNVAVRAE